MELEAENWQLCSTTLVLCSTFAKMHEQRFFPARQLTVVAALSLHWSVLTCFVKEHRISLPHAHFLSPACRELLVVTRSYW